MDNVNEAKNLLLQQKKETEDACVNEIGDVLKKHNCHIDIEMLIRQAGNIPIIKVVLNG
jgi:hypothetical protein